MAKNVEWARKLPADTKLFFGHDYLHGNMKFAKLVDPNNPSFEQLQQREDLKASKGYPRLPSSIEQELKTNVFFRFDQPDIMTTLKAADAVDSMRKLRLSKDQGSLII